MNRDLFTYDENLGFRYIPGVRTRVQFEDGAYLVRVNQAGFRSEKEFESRKKPGTRRLLIFGDSFTDGH